MRQESGRDWPKNSQKQAYSAKKYFQFIFNLFFSHGFVGKLAVEGCH
jgi:hypothetical protein|tara:strand:- start:207 stop:347 length:141 start_codon:yes stop_codon:yes gene_type:complete